MKKIIAIVAVMLAVSGISSVYAQQGQMDPAARQAAMKQKLKDDLKLTDVQADSVTAIQQEFRPQMRTIMMDQTLSADDKKAKLQPISDAADKRIQAVLGDDLFKKYKDWREANRPQRGGGGRTN
jgi:Tfp pilus assembly protein PilO